MSPPVKSVCIIGGGVSGLAAVKACLEEGLIPTCFEKQETIGGLWNIREGDIPEHLDIQSRVYSNCTMNVSKLLNQFSDFPSFKESPNFFPCRTFLPYIKAYAANFDLNSYVQLNTHVTAVEKSSDFEATGRWKVTYQRMQEHTGKRDEPITEKFDAIMLANGDFNRQNWIHIPGQENFTGTITHSGNYFSNQDFKDKTVVVIGGSVSGVDISTDISKTAQKTYLSCPNGLWVLPRMLDGVPYDYALFNRWNSMTPLSITVKNLNKRLNTLWNPNELGIAGKYGIFNQSITVNDTIQMSIMEGKLQAVKADVAEITSDGNGVRFKNGLTLPKVDAIVLCTGFSKDYTILKDADYLADDPEEPDSFMSIFPIDLQPRTLAFITHITVIGQICPVAELHARLAARVFAGKVELPSKEAMKTVVKRTLDSFNKQYAACRRRKLKMPPFVYTEELAEILGVRPRVWRLFLTDPDLAWKCLMDPAIPAQYRISGPGAKPQLARKLIMESEENHMAPLYFGSAKNSSNTFHSFPPYLYVVFTIFMTFIPVLITLPFINYS